MKGRRPLPVPPPRISPGALGHPSGLWPCPWTHVPSLLPWALPRLDGEGTRTEATLHSSLSRLDSSPQEDKGRDPSPEPLIQTPREPELTEGSGSGCPGPVLGSVATLTRLQLMRELRRFGQRGSPSRSGDYDVCGDPWRRERSFEAKRGRERTESAREAEVVRKGIAG